MVPASESERQEMERLRARLRELEARQGGDGGPPVRRPWKLRLALGMCSAAAMVAAWVAFRQMNGSDQSSFLVPFGLLGLAGAAVLTGALAWRGPSAALGAAVGFVVGLVFGLAVTGAASAGMAGGNPIESAVLGVVGVAASLALAGLCAAVGALAAKSARPVAAHDGICASLRS